MESDKKTKKGTRLQKSWDSLKSGGGHAPSKDAIEQMLKVEPQADRVLSRSEVIQIVTDYFMSCIEETVDDNGEIVTTWKTAPTKSGLSLALHITPQVLIDYVRGCRSDGKMYGDTPEKKRHISVGDFDILRRAVLIIESYYESKLSENRNVAGCIFWLLNSESDHWSNEQRSIVEYRRTPQVLSASDLPRIGKMEQMPDVFALSRVVDDQEPIQIKNQEVHGCDAD